MNERDTSKLPRAASPSKDQRSYGVERPTELPPGAVAKKKTLRMMGRRQPRPPQLLPGRGSRQARPGDSIPEKPGAGGAVGRCGVGVAGAGAVGVSLGRAVEDPTHSCVRYKPFLSTIFLSWLAQLGTWRKSGVGTDTTQTLHRKIEDDSQKPDVRKGIRAQKTVAASIKGRGRGGIFQLPAVRGREGLAALAALAALAVEQKPAVPTVGRWCGWCGVLVLELLALPIIALLYFRLLIKKQRTPPPPLRTTR
ncbi:hypothetical protein THAOC_08353 [Thalassiosira oceanica]|uniref:Uncharacterized protein n=1 Tax=Thalassiosira oceanica TaxID=159749 RepID=K0SZ80_THAOC|nr:hypothetical protein THAOC_08353 [Thalassiosira oceanica]|eukprot:EJK70299.1 hypothetical protein THAOC_08353 [Thalassiosira oceanica]